MRTPVQIALPAVIAPLLLCPSLAAQQPALTADAIMARVAANQDSAEAERQHFVYVQHARVQSRKGKTVMCEEITDSRVAPGAKGQQQVLLTLQGRAVGKRGETVTYDSLPGSFHNADGSRKTEKNSDSEGDTVTLDDTSHGGQPVTLPDTDVDLVENMRNNLLQDKSKDGITAHLFPFTTAEQKKMRFTLKKRETRNGRDTWHIVFAPRDSEFGEWKGDVWVDTTAFQPVVIQTALAKNVPLGVRVLLGTSVPGLGFTAIYTPQHVDGADDVWFPASFGTEFKLNVLFFFHRQIVLNAENRQFERTHVRSTIHSDDPAPQPTVPQP